ncbi:hypothetical protein BV898_08604 [Hypsibius exemplaris]|uniref:LITAF domain-containing protein n=1 Tax=Hypsibius exemplaris TaxID=2072580 RepID=A0A1W0WQ78_HYPEX|nr:hypothetical protein BV898_08604 [Hypsibius exemplaris]
MNEKHGLPPVRYETDVVGPPPFYKPRDGDPDLVRTETKVEYEDSGLSSPISSTTTTTVINGEIDEIVFLQPYPTEVQCPNCGQIVITEITYENGVLTWLLAAGIAVLGGWLGCFLIPTCVNSCKDARHTCPRCQRLIGKYRRL